MKIFIDRRNNETRIRYSVTFICKKDRNVIKKKKKKTVHLLPNDRVGLKRVRDTKKPSDIFALEKIVTGHVARLHVRIDLGIALPTIERHLVSAQMNVLIREHLHDLGEQVAEELVQSRIRRIHRAQFTIRLSLHI